MKKSDEMPRSYKCALCGKENAFGEWLFAHWHIPTVHLCECGARAELLRGRPIALIMPSAFHLATGEMLDHYGRLCGVERNASEPDFDYRTRIFLRATEAASLKARHG